MLFVAPGTLRFSTEAKAAAVLAEIPAGHAHQKGNELKIVKDTEIAFRRPKRGALFVALSQDDFRRSSFHQRA